MLVSLRSDYSRSIGTGFAFAEVRSSADQRGRSAANALTDSSPDRCDTVQPVHADAAAIPAYDDARDPDYRPLWMLSTPLGGSGDGGLPISLDGDEDPVGGRVCQQIDHRDSRVQ